MQRSDNFARFTEGARKVLTLSQSAAERLNRNYIEPEHILLALVKEEEGMASRVLRELGIEFAGLQDWVVAVVGKGQREVTGEIGLTPRAKRVIESSVDEARRLGHNYIGTEHLLLGLLREWGETAGDLLAPWGVTVENARSELIKVVVESSGGNASRRLVPQPNIPPPPPSRTQRSPRPDRWQYLTARVSRQESGTLIEIAWQEDWRREEQFTLPGMLDFLGRHGWELTNVHAAGAANQALYAFRRPEPFPAERARRPQAASPADRSVEYAFASTGRELLDRAQQEARRLGHRQFDTDHLLLGLLRLDDGLGLQILTRLGLVPDQVQSEIEAQIAHESGEVTGPIAPTADTLAVLAWASSIARTEDAQIGDEHVLLALLELGESRVAGMLGAHGITMEAAREALRTEREESAMEQWVGGSEHKPTVETGSFDRFTERARKVLVLAQEEAQRFNHGYISTEHLLLGLVREGEGIAAKVLTHLGIETLKVRAAVEFIIARNERTATGDVGLTPRSRRALELARDESRRFGHHYIGTEHLLLGLIREGQGIAAGVLESLGAGAEAVRAEVSKILASPPEQHQDPKPSPAPPGWEYIVIPVREQATESESHVLVCGRPLTEGEAPGGIAGMHLQHALRLLGAQGWELAAIDSAHHSGEEGASLYVFKRRE